MEKLSNNYYMEEAPVIKSILHFSTPMMLGLSVNVLYSILNAFFIGLLHNTSMMAAVTFGLPVTTVMMAIGNVFGTGGGTYISRLLGEKQEDKARATAVFAFYGSLVSGILLAVVFLCVANPVVHLLGAHADSFAFTKSYVMVMFAGSPLIVCNFALEQIVRAEGATRISMIGMFITTITNFLLDPVLILFLHMNVFGAGLSTVLANGVSVLYYVWYIHRKSGVLSISATYFIAPLDIASNTFRIGISELLLSAFLILSTLLLNHYSVHYGASVVAGFGISLRIVQVHEFLAMGIYMGIIPLLGFAYGAKAEDRLRQSIWVAGVLIGLIVLIVAIPVFIFRTGVVHLFSLDPNVIATGTQILTAMLISTIFAGYTGLFTAIFQATGKSVESVVMSVAHGVLFIPTIMIGNHFWGLRGLIWSLTVTEVLTCAVGCCVLMFSHTRNIAGSTEGPRQVTEGKLNP